MKRALMYASVASMIQQFNMENICLLLKQGYEVDVACNMEFGSSVSGGAISEMKQELENMGVRVFHIPVPRKITDVKHIFRSIQYTRALMDENQYTLIHCHSPIGGMICRVAYRLSSNYRNGKMIYTAHGFHFYKGAPMLNWLLYYPVEKICSIFTDTLITINKEDYELALKRMHTRCVNLVQGVGIDTQKFGGQKVDVEEFRNTVGIPEDAFLLTSVGELNENKNHSVVIRALAQLDNPNIHYAIVGKGVLEQSLRELSEKLGVGKQIHLLGYRSDVAQIYAVSDACVFPSIREGLGLAALEGMASGLPLICSDNRGTRCYAIDGDNALVCDPDDVQAFATAIKRLVSVDEKDRKEMGSSACQTAKAFDVNIISLAMERIYRDGY